MFSVIRRILLTCLLPLSALAQLGGTVSDSNTGKTLDNAIVLINKTTLFTISDDQGKFSLDYVPPGQSELVIYKKGYSIFRSFIKTLEGKPHFVFATLSHAENKKPKRISSRDLTALQGALLKTSIDSLPPIALNNDDIVTHRADDKTLITFSEPLVIKNNRTGFIETFFAVGLPTDKFQDLPVKYEYIPPVSFKESVAREKYRQERFRGSLRHFLIAVANDSLKVSGYSVTDRNGKDVNVDSLVRPMEPKGTFRFKPASYTVRFKRDEQHVETSMITIGEPTDINLRGILIRPVGWKTEGAMEEVGLASQLPNNYKPVNGDVEEHFMEMLRRSYEKVYVHTDKSYYYPGENIWLSAYINYYVPEEKDYLSKTLYVELINPRKEIIATKTLRLDSGLVNTDFSLPDSTLEGNYYIRAYTQLQRNFGDDNLFMKPLPVLKLTKKPVYSDVREDSTSASLFITTSKPTYHRREMVTVNVQLNDSTGQPLKGNFSVSVTDASQVMKIKEWGTILDKFPISKKDIGKANDITYTVERGITLRGQFFNPKGKGEKKLLNIIQFEPYNLAFVDTDETGFFSHECQPFYNEAAFTINPSGREGKDYGKAIILKRDIPAVLKDTAEYILPTIDVNSVQRILSEYEKPNDVTLLEAVEIRAKRIDESAEAAKKVNRPYGQGDYVFDEKSIKTQFPNLLFTLQALNVSGMVVNPITETVYFERQQKPVTIKTGDDDSDQEIAKSYTPMVTLDGTPLIGSAGEALLTIDPSSVGYIEITKRSSSIRGTRAPFGVIAVFTKTGMRGIKKQDVAGVDVIKVRGYSIINHFRHPDYDSKETDKTLADYRSTLYWNPTVKAGDELSFYTSDLTGRCRIVIEGVTETGRPVRSVTFFEVKE